MTRYSANERDSTEGRWPLWPKSSGIETADRQAKAKGKDVHQKDKSMVWIRTQILGGCKLLPTKITGGLRGRLISRSRRHGCMMMMMIFLIAELQTVALQLQQFNRRMDFFFMGCDLL